LSRPKTSRRPAGSAKLSARKPPIVDSSAKNPDSGAGFWSKAQRVLVRRRTFFNMIAPLALIVFAQRKGDWPYWGLGFACCGMAIRFWSAGHLVKSAQLTTSGPFARMRHPLYLGSLFIATGYCFMSGCLVAFPVVWGLYALFFVSAMLHEEKMLLSAFGDEYRAYMAQTPRIFPRFTPIPNPQGRFTFRQMLVNREPRVALGVLVTLGLFFVRWAIPT